MIVILLNTMLMLGKAIENDPKNELPGSFYSLADEYLLYIYTVEMSIKIIVLGFILNENSYLRDMWNMLDFVVIAGGWITYFLGIFHYFNYLILILSYFLKC